MAQTHTHSGTLIWTGAAQGPTKSYTSYSREHVVTFAGKPPVTVTADPHFRGDPAVLNPEELLLAALASCHMLTYLSWAARKGIAVTAYEDAPVGTVSVQGGAGEFTEVVLRPRVTIAAGSDTALAASLHDDAHRDCFIARSVNFTVRHEPEILEH